MAGLADLVTLAQDHTWFMVVLLWLGTAAAYRSLHSEITDIESDVESVSESQANIKEQVNRVGQKQNHIVSRQEMVLERMGMNAQEIQEIQEEQARLDVKTQMDDEFYRGDGSGSEGD